jgi:hypothetical protein
VPGRGLVVSWRGVTRKIPEMKYSGRAMAAMISQAPRRARRERRVRLLVPTVPPWAGWC